MTNRLAFAAVLLVAVSACGDGRAPRSSVPSAPTIRVERADDRERTAVMRVVILGANVGHAEVAMIAITGASRPRPRDSPPG
jgi:hypothetical protein